jgi:hypothetical protein
MIADENRRKLFEAEDPQPTGGVMAENGDPVCALTLDIDIVSRNGGGWSEEGPGSRPHRDRGPPHGKFLSP